MTKISELYTLYLKAHHLPTDGSAREATIESAISKTVHPRPGLEEERIVVSFVGKKHKLILNQTNANTMFDVGGDDPAAWGGLIVRLRRDKWGKNDTIIIERNGN